MAPLLPTILNVSPNFTKLSALLSAVNLSPFSSKYVFTALPVTNWSFVVSEILVAPIPVAHAFFFASSNVFTFDPSTFAYPLKSVASAFFAISDFNAVSFAFNCFPVIASVDESLISPSAKPVNFLLFTVISFSFSVILALLSPDDIDVIPVKSPLTSTLNVAFLLASSFVNVTVVFVPSTNSNVSSFIFRSFVVGFFCFPSLNFNFELDTVSLTFVISFAT